jgi:hypothetical protein
MHGEAETPRLGRARRAGETPDFASHYPIGSQPGSLVHHAYHDTLGAVSGAPKTALSGAGERAASGDINRRKGRFSPLVRGEGVADVAASIRLSPDGPSATPAIR